jgi:ferric-dicitrate binding protein FerR (iron transport regulator)
MEINKDLIRKFFASQCTAEEFETVMNYLDSHPEFLAKEMGFEEWSAKEPLPSIGDKDQAAMLDELKQQLFNEQTPIVALPQTDWNADNKNHNRIRRFRRTAIAAALLLIAGAGSWLFLTKKSASNNITAAPEVTRQQTAAVWIIKNNPSATIKSITLPDGSKVKLAAHSTLRYTDSFGLARRDSWLEGDAEFSVKKDKTHPFTVYSDRLATTALGTTFCVTASPGGESIQLFSGRVIVRSIRSLKGWNKDIYLSPGEQVSYDSHRLVAKVSSFNVKPAPGDDLATAAAATATQDLVFNNSPLKDVFNRLSIQYHKKITWHARDISGLNFTGTVPRTDSLDVILRLLAGMNNLDVQEQPDGYQVARVRQ